VIELITQRKTETRKTNGNMACWVIGAPRGLSKGGTNVASHNKHDRLKNIQAMTVCAVPIFGIVMRVSQKVKNKVPQAKGLKGSPGRTELAMRDLLLSKVGIL